MPARLPAALGSELERAFDTQVRSLAPDLPRGLANHRFAEDRNWQFDRAWPDYKVAVELEGGSYGQRIVCHNCGAVVRATTKTGSPGRELRAVGGHQRVGRFTADREKYNAAELLGWTVLRFLHDDVYGNPWQMVEAIRQALENRAWRKRLVERLTPYQDSVLHMIAGGAKASEIAVRLGVTETAVKKQTQSLCEKLMATNRAALVARGLAWGLIEPERISWEWENVRLTAEEVE